MTITTRQDQPTTAVTDTDAEAITRVARSSTAPTEVLVPDDDGDALEARIYGYHPDTGHGLVDVVDLEQERDRPRIKRGDVAVATPKALATYANRHLDHDRSTLWGDIDAGRIVVVLNDHGAGDGPHDTGWADHRAALQLQRSPEWRAWTGIDSHWLSQTELAEFLEERLLEVHVPDGSTLLEVTQTFHATTDARFKSSQQLHSGEQRLIYEQDVQASAGRTSQVEVPTDLTVRLRPWLGVDPVDIAGKFRFRVRDGQLMLGVKLLHLDDVSRTAVEAALADVAHELVLDPIEGVAPSARR